MEFSISRVGSLMKRDIILNGKSFLLLAIAFSCITALIMFISTEEYCDSIIPTDLTEVILYSILLLGGLIFSVSIFTEFREESTRAMYLSLPSSSFEKWLSKWIIALPLFTLVSWCIISISYMVMGTIIENIWIDCQFLPLKQGINNSVIHASKVYLVFQSIAFFLGIMLNKHALLKAIPIGFLLFMLVGYFLEKLARASISTNYLTKEHLELHSNIFINSLLFVIPIIWLASFFKLKEKQI